MAQYYEAYSREYALRKGTSGFLRVFVEPVKNGTQFSVIDNRKILEQFISSETEDKAMKDFRTNPTREINLEWMRTVSIDEYNHKAKKI